MCSSSLWGGGGVAEFLGAQISNPQALWLSALIIPVIILYILKPKPKTLKFPSVMFIELIEKSHRLRGFLEKIIGDPLLFLQILLIILFSLLLADPLLNLRDVVRQKENVVYVIDASASMTASDVHPTRFNRALELVVESKNQLHPQSRASLVLSGVSPIQVLSQADPEKLQKTLENLKPHQAPASLSDALYLASDLRSPDTRNRVFAVSDFAEDPNTINSAVALLKNRGFKVDLVKVGGQAENVGVVGCHLQRRLLTENQLTGLLALSNFGQQARQVKVNLVDGGNAVKSYDIQISPGGREVVELEAETDLSAKNLVVKAETRDALGLDDSCYFHLPAVKVNKVLLLSSEGKDRYLRLLLESLPHVEYQAANPPVIPPVTDFDVVIMSDVKADAILPGTFRDLKNHVKKGAAFIALSSDALDDVTSKEFWSMMDLELEGLIETQTPVVKASDHVIVESTSYANTV
ncbi:MAG: VWA domain-containing protein, partial [Candidatus Altiarchaeales archaeon]|nr:VWA domain-containing protein [Candidatus Altiarchaeales archaeon]